MQSISLAGGITPYKVEIVQGIQHQPWAQAKIDRSRDELVEEREAVKDLIP